MSSCHNGRISQRHPPHIFSERPRFRRRLCRQRPPGAYPLRQADNTRNGTILAIKVRDLELLEPDDLATKNMERYQIYHGAAPSSDTGQTPNKPNVIPRAPQESPAHEPTPYLQTAATGQLYYGTCGSSLSEAQQTPAQPNAAALLMIKLKEMIQ